MRHAMDSIAVTCIIFILSACGGGSNDSADTTLPPPSSAPITEENRGEIPPPSSPLPSPRTEDPTPPPSTEQPSSEYEETRVAIDLLNARWTIRDLTDLLPETTFPADINDKGDILGTESILEPGPPHTLRRVIGSRSFIISQDTFIPINGSYNAVRINNFGQISLNSYDYLYYSRWAPSEELAFSEGIVQATPLQLMLPAGVFRATDMNNAGQILGTFLDTKSGNQQAFLYQRGEITTFEALTPWPKTDARAINDHGEFVGCAYVTVASHCEVGYVHRNGRYIDIGKLPGKAYANPLDINNAGQIIGYANNTEDNSAWQFKNFLYENGTLRELELPGVGGFVREINDFGQIVGYRWRGNAGTSQFAFVLHEGQVIELSELADVRAAGYHIHSAYALNNRGQILAIGIPLAGGMSRSLLLTPRPSSSSAPME